MAGANVRSEYYWIDGRVVRRRVHRSSGYGPWPVRSDEDQDRLVCTIEMSPAGIKLVPGPARTPDREWVAVLMEYGHYAPEGRPDLGRGVPPRLLDRVRRVAEAAVREVTRQFQELGSEERATGALVSKLDAEYKLEGWRIAITSQGYSSSGKEEPKEKRIGADAGIVIDIANGDDRVVKAMLVQAKRTDEVPDDPFALPGLDEQLPKMREITEEAYVWVYTPDGILANRRDNDRDISISEQLVAGIICDRGDHRQLVVAVAQDRDYVVEILASGPKSVNPRTDM
jgi:hypothetical protein